MKALIFLALLASATLADCVPKGNGCTDAAFMQAGLVLYTSCVTQSNTLMASLNVSTTASQFDAAWQTFCTGSCHTAMLEVDPKYFCCIDEYGLGTMFNNLIQFCKMSKQSPTRRCGAELGNLGAVACQASNANDCAALGTCEWAENMCLFKPTKENLDMVCTDCNRAYFENFPAGGVNPPATFSKLAAVFDYACNKIEDQYCLLSAANHGYRSVGSLVPADLNAYCGNPTNTIEKRCFRALTATNAKTLAYNARYADLFCQSGCTETLVRSLTLSRALETAAATMCANDGSNNCFGQGALALQDQCTAMAALLLECDGECDVNATSTALNLGCCGPTFSTSGAIIAQQAPVSGRLLLASIAASSNNVNQTYTSYPKNPLSSAELQQFTLAANQQATTDTFAGLQYCSSFSPQYSSWISNASKCTVRPFTRTYVFVLQLNYVAFNACPYSFMVKNSLVADIIPKLGITSAQLVGSANFASHSNGTKMTIKISAESAVEIQQIDAAVAAGISFPLLTAGREFMFTCPSILISGVYTPVVLSVTPSSVVGDVEILTTIATTTQTTVMETAPTAPSAATAVSLQVALVTVIICALLAL